MSTMALSQQYQAPALIYLSLLILTMAYTSLSEGHPLQHVLNPRQALVRKQPPCAQQVRSFFGII